MASDLAITEDRLRLVPDQLATVTATLEWSELTDVARSEATGIRDALLWVSGATAQPPLSGGPAHVVADKRGVESEMILADMIVRSGHPPNVVFRAKGVLRVVDWVGSSWVPGIRNEPPVLWRRPEPRRRSA